MLILITQSIRGCVQERKPYVSIRLWILTLEEEMIQSAHFQSEAGRTDDTDAEETDGKFLIGRKVRVKAEKSSGDAGLESVGSTRSVPVAEEESEK